MLLLNRDAFLGQSQKILFRNISSYLSLPRAPAALLEYSFSSFLKTKFPSLLISPGADARHTNRTVLPANLVHRGWQGCRRGERRRAGGRGLCRSRRAATLRNAQCPRAGQTSAAPEAAEGERAQQHRPCPGCPPSACGTRSARPSAGGAAACPCAAGRAGWFPSLGSDLDLHPAPTRASRAPLGLRRWLCRWNAPARSSAWALRCRHPRLSCGAVWGPCRRNTKSLGSVETLPTNRRAMQGWIAAPQRAAEPAQLLQQVTSGWAVEALHKHVLAREPAALRAPSATYCGCTSELDLLCLISLIKIRIWSLCYISVKDRAGI